MQSEATEKRLVAVNVEQFVRTRDALNTAFLGLSASIDKAIKAYIDHTQAVLDGDNTLDISYLTQPFNSLTTAAHIAQQAIGFQNGEIVDANPAAGGKRRKRAYKPRDPNAPKRPLTAYFRYLGVQRPILAAELAADPNRETGKAGDISKIATEQWNALPKEEQQPYRNAYKHEMKRYHQEVAEYKKQGGQVDEDDDAPGEEDLELAVKNEGQAQAAAAQENGEEDDDSDDSTSDEESDEEDAPAQTPVPPPAPPAPMKTASSSPEALKKTPKPAAKRNKAVDAVTAPPQQFSSIPPPQQFSSINPALTVSSPAPAEAPPKKRKTPATVVAGEDEPSTKKRVRKTKAEKAAEDSAAAAAQLVTESSQPVPGQPVSSQPPPEVKKARKDKKRKSEAAT